jgi:hypothetical protein
MNSGHTGIGLDILNEIHAEWVWGIKSASSAKFMGGFFWLWEPT